jgi:phospholipase C
VISGQTNGVIDNTNGSGAITADGNGGFSDTGDADPAGDMCSTTTGETFSMSGQNIGDLLNAKGISWGFFSGGFNLNITNANGSTGCARSTTSAITLSKKADYIPHHQPFQYYASTANPLHTRPASIAEIGHKGPANHQYDILDFYAAVSAGNLPAVSYLKAPGFQDGHAGYSDPIDEQTFVVNTINLLQKSPEWQSTAVIIAYDDSDGWYDHVTSPLVNQSATASDQNTQTEAYMCGSVASATTTALPGVSTTTTHAQGRCGYGPRQPFLVISPYAKRNYVDHATTDQSSVVRFIEDNWLGGERIVGSFDAVAGSINGMFDFERCREDGILILDPTTGEPKGPSFKF